MPGLVIGIGTVGIESSLLLAYLVLIFVSWRSSLLIANMTKERGILLRDSTNDNDDEAGVPLQYRA
jgi:hypothetical protein